MLEKTAVKFYKKIWPFYVGTDSAQTSNIIHIPRSELISPADLKGLKNAPAWRQWWQKCFC